MQSVSQGLPSTSKAAPAPVLRVPAVRVALHGYNMEPLPAEQRTACDKHDEAKRKERKKVGLKDTKALDPVVVKSGPRRNTTKYKGVGGGSNCADELLTPAGEKGHDGRGRARTTDT